MRIIKDIIKNIQGVFKADYGDPLSVAEGFCVKDKTFKVSFGEISITFDICLN